MSVFVGEVLVAGLVKAGQQEQRHLALHLRVKLHLLKTDTCRLDCPKMTQSKSGESHNERRRELAVSIKTSAFLGTTGQFEFHNDTIAFQLITASNIYSHLEKTKYMGVRFDRSIRIK